MMAGLASGSRAVIRAHQERLLIDRGRLFLWMMIAIVAGMWGLNASGLMRAPAISLPVLNSIELCILTVTVTQLRRPWCRRHILGLSVAYAVQLIACITLYGLWTEDLWILSLRLEALSLAAAVLPWGVAAQGVVAAASGLGFASVHWSLNGTLDHPSTIPTVILFAVSLPIAFWLKQAHADIATEIDRRRTAESVLRQATEGAQVAVWDADLEAGKVRLVSGWDRLLGRYEDEITPVALLDLIHVDDRAKTTVALQEHLQGHKSPCDIEHRFLHADGSYRWVLTRSAINCDAQGRPYRMQGAVMDITDRKRLDEALQDIEVQEQVGRERERLFLFLDSIVENIPAMVFVKDAKDLRFVLFNRAGEELLGYTRADLIGKNDYELFPKEQADFFTGKDRAVLYDKTLLDIPEERISTLHRGERILHTKKIPILDDKGEPVYLLGISEDITERAHAEEVRQRHARETRVLSDILSALNAHQDTVRAFPVISAGLQEISGCDVSVLALTGADKNWMTLYALGPGELSVEPGARLRVADMPAANDVLSGRPYVAPDLASQLDFPMIQFLYALGYRASVAVPLHGSDDILGMLGLLWRGHADLDVLPILGQIGDALALAVEKRRLFEQVSAAHKGLRALARRFIEVQEAERRYIARELHDEIGQHLTGISLILGAVEHLSAEGAVARLKEVRALVAGLIARVRDVSLDLRPAMLDDLGVLPALLWLFDRYTAQTGITVAFNHRALQQRFMAEQETALYRTVQEALTNAARHAGVASVDVDAWADGDTLGVSISDHGAGFDVDAVLANGMAGGLAGLRERATLLGGRLTIESKPGAGTRVSAEFPLSAEPGLPM
jgi:PAS domain S-box-containing protein